MAAASEFELIARYFAPLARATPGARGLLDDAAVLAPPAGHDLVITKDMLAEGVHFLPGDPPETIAHKLLAVNMSDLASMGAVPAGCVLGLGCPAGADVEPWVARFADGLAAALQQFGCGLYGGDTISGLERWTLSLTAFGWVPHGSALSRAGAQLGDDVYVSGDVGAAALGLAALQSGNDGPADWIARYRCPAPRLALGVALRGVASACADVSDGLLADAGHIAHASGLGVEIDLASVPHDPAQDAMAAATAGDDYELVFTLPPDRAAALLTISQDLGLKLTRVGVMKAQAGVQVRLADGQRITPQRLGYQHG